MEKLSEAKAQQLLRKEGIEMKPEDVKVALTFLRHLAKIIVANYTRRPNISDVKS